MIRPLAALACALLLAAPAAAEPAATAPSQPAAPPAPAPQVAFTFDDLPLASGAPGPVTAADIPEAIQVNLTLLRALVREHVPATGFVIQQNVERIGEAAALDILQLWAGRGFDLGDHLYSHPDVNRLTPEQVEQEIVRGEPAIDQVLGRLGRRPRYLRFPYNHTGDTPQKHAAIAAIMAAHGYRLAPCTIDNDDYDFNRAYALALGRHDEASAAKIRAAYLAFTAAEIDWYSRLDREVFGYAPPHVMLLHASPLNRDTIEAVIGLFRQRGYRFVSLTQALKDPAYAVPETYVTPYGPMWGYRWARELKVRVNGALEPDPPAWIDQYGKPPKSG